jgi:CubicO group peptidase (beta-lactamase class C family)
VQQGSFAARALPRFLATTDPAAPVSPFGPLPGVSGYRAYLLVYSTPSDMARWLDALYKRKTVLADETVETMLEFVGPVDGEPLMKGYGLGVVDIDLGALMPQWEHVRIYGHWGLAFGYMKFAGYSPTMESPWRLCRTEAATKARTER